MDRRSLLKSIAGIAGVPAIARSQIVDDVDKPKLLILSFDEYLMVDQCQAIHDSVKNHLPNWKVLILDGGATFEVRDV